MLDFYDLDALLTDEQKAIRDTVRSFVDSEVLPGIREWWDEGSFPTHLIPQFGELGLLGSTLPSEYGGAEVDNVAYGLIQYELERGDSGLRSFASVMSGLVMYPEGHARNASGNLPALLSHKFRALAGLGVRDVEGLLLRFSGLGKKSAAELRTLYDFEIAR